MRRRTFDILVATAGLVLAVTLIASGVLLTWAHTFIGGHPANGQTPVPASAPANQA
ncbi:MAG: hypothetical protein ACLQB1_14570 [Streptosporangiaceae bacterium]